MADDQNLTPEDTAQTVMDELGQSLPADPAALTFRLLFSQFSATTSGVRQLLATSSADPGPPVQAQQAIEELAPANTYHGQGVGEIAAFLFGLLDPASALTAGQCAILAGWIVDAARKSAKREFLSGQIAVGTITEDETTIWTPAKCRLLQERLSSVDLQLRADFADLFYRGATTQ